MLDVTLDEAIAIGRSLERLFFVVAVLTFFAWLAARMLKIKIKRVTPLALVVALGAVLRLSQIDASFWYDETFTAAVSSLNLRDLPSAIIADVHPPLMYLIQWMTYHTIGTSETALRLPSLAFGIGAIWMMYHAARSTTRSHHVALTAALIVAVLPAAIRYSVEARAYSAMLFFVLLGVWSINNKRLHWLVLAIALLPALHNLGYLYAAALGAAGLHRLRRRALPQLVAAAVPGALWLPAMFHQSRYVSESFWMTGLHPEGIIAPLYTMTIGAGHGVTLDIVAIATVSALTFAGLSLHDQLKKRFAFIVVAFGVPGAAAAASFAWTDVYLHRALLPSSMLIVIAWSMAMRHHAIYRALSLVVFTALLLSYSTTNTMRSDIRSYIAACGDETVYTLSTATAIQARYYARGDVWLSPDGNDRNQALPHDVIYKMGIRIGETDEIDGSFCLVYQADIYTLIHQTKLESILTRPHTSTIHRQTITSAFMTFIVQ